MNCSDTLRSLPTSISRCGCQARAVEEGIALEEASTAHAHVIVVRAHLVACKVRPCVHRSPGFRIGRRRRGCRWRRMRCRRRCRLRGRCRTLRCGPPRQSTEGCATQAQDTNGTRSVATHLHLYRRSSSGFCGLGGAKDKGVLSRGAAGRPCFARHACARDWRSGKARRPLAPRCG